VSKLSHYDDRGRARMVDVSTKFDTVRTARARAFVKLKPAVIRALPENPKGDPLETARLAGIMAAKKTSDLIPMCHPLAIKHADIEVRMTRGGIELTASVTTTGPTGVEMEALTAVTVAALTVYDMTKALDNGISIREIYLLEKTGGKSGSWKRKPSG
jgi:cyclic pyranopterin phosphate synthase